MKPIVEVLLATYNGEQFLAAQLESLLSQTFSEFSIIARDDCSTDSTWNILKHYERKFPHRICVYQANSKDSHGPVANFSALLGLSQAPYVMFCDQDDIWFSNKILAFFERMKELELVWGAGVPLLIHSDSKVVNCDLEILHSSFFKYAGLKPQNTSLNHMLVQNVITGFSLMLNRALLTRAFPIPNEALMHDWWVALIGVSIGHSQLISESTAFYRQHGSNTLGARKWPNNIAGIVESAIQNVFSSRTKKVFQGYYRQAELLLERVEEDLPMDQKLILITFIQLQHQGWLEKRIQLLRFNFLKGNFLKNLGVILGI